MTTAPDPLTSTAAAVLGLVGLGAGSGYAVRQATERSLRFFWALSPPQIYSELKRLERDGLLVGRDEARGERARREYELTGAGAAALRDWVASSPSDAMEIRDTTLLRLFFADVLPVEEAVRHVAAMRDRSARMLDRFDAEIQPAAVRAEADTQARFPAHVAAFGRELHAFVVDWCDRLQDELGPAPDG